MAWQSEIYRRTALIVLSIIFVSGIITYIFRRQNHYFTVAWASIKSWIVLAPILFVLFGLPDPWPTIVLTVIALLGAKVFFQILGIYHFTSFVLICYAGIIGLAVCSRYENLTMYNNMPMAVLGLCCMIPLARNRYRHMIQYISLTLLGFIFLGWSFMHLALIIKLNDGLYQMLYLIVLTEFCDNTNIAVGRTIGGRKIFNKINSKRTLISTIVSMALTLFLAATMAWLLPDPSGRYWLASGLIASLGGLVGNLVMDVLRRDAGVRIVGQFIIGRGDFLNRMDRLIFVAPLYYYVMLLIQRYS